MTRLFQEDANFGNMTFSTKLFFSRFFLQKNLIFLLILKISFDAVLFILADSPQNS